jgi:predicted DNA-binding transcriptional regulator YafY
MESVEQILISAIETGEIINIKYHGGSQPGSIRQISPISVKAENVRARCLSTNRVKVFKLSRIEIERSSTLTNTYVPGKKTPEPTSLKEAFESHRELLSNLGWLLSVEDEGAGVYRTFQNGKLRKTPDVYIQYFEFKYDYTDDDEGNEIEYTKPSERPWYVRSNTRDQASSFKKLSVATDKFVLLAKEAAETLKLSKNG